MSRAKVAVALVALVIVVGWLLGDDPKKTAHQLPAGWGMLGLSDAQLKQIHSVQDEYGPKVAALKKQLEDLQVEERAKLYEVLTPDQKKQLKGLRDIRDSDDKKAEKKP